MDTRLTLRAAIRTTTEISNEPMRKGIELRAILPGQKSGVCGYSPQPRPCVSRGGHGGEKKSNNCQQLLLGDEPQKVASDWAFIHLHLAKPASAIGNLKIKKDNEDGRI